MTMSEVINVCSRCGEAFIAHIPVSYLPDPDKEGWLTYYAICTECGHKGPERATPKEAYAAWSQQENSRNATQALRSCLVDLANGGDPGAYDIEGLFEKARQELGIGKNCRCQVRALEKEV